MMVVIVWNGKDRTLVVVGPKTHSAHDVEAADVMGPVPISDDAAKAEETSGKTVKTEATTPGAIAASVSSDECADSGLSTTMERRSSKRDEHQHTLLYIKNAGIPRSRSIAEYLLLFQPQSQAVKHDFFRERLVLN